MKSSFGFLFFLFSFALLAQEGESPLRDKIEQYRIQFITQKMDLSVEEGQRFWPLYNAYQKELGQIQDHRRQQFIRRRLGGDKLETLSESEIESLVLEELDRLAGIAELKKRYYSQFKQAVGIRKTARFFQAEVEFQRHLMDRLAQRRRGG